ncbi:deoxyadenosine/deoxycytidine kinase [Neobacillus bataviensis]|uniref:Deoxyadenosine/deoxycytidine kinase n=1 Tax=Neobacillus bataviensis TaxID=220685 RepID=A0A561CA63_9BACI|nr:MULTISPECIES: deoxynucleoside kinase [Bacillaceae]PFN74926.1 deoxynucleoside kinase [Bacillus sp. AFS076308]PGV48529.1 deoxynucleoside kinase [Bacillus sp. AFS037270]TWD87918.1 deoxyadenosine/deoxycytidine kinase [Neobacillus bataviensis]
MSIVIGGMIGLGKTSVADTLNAHFKNKGIESKVFYEAVDDNPILPLYYELTPEELDARRIPFLLQLFFLNKRFKTVKECVNWREPVYTIQDRSIYEDWYFAYVNKNLGRISELEFKIYEELVDNMMEELNELPKKAPDLMVYLKGSFDTVIDRIMARGRSFEINPELKEYYFEVWKGYDEWVLNQYAASEVLVIDMDNTDVVKSKADAIKVCNAVDEKLNKILKIEKAQIG